MLSGASKYTYLYAWEHTYAIFEGCFTFSDRELYISELCPHTPSPSALQLTCVSCLSENINLPFQKDGFLTKELS